MKAYSLLYLSLCSLVTLYACQSSHITQMEKKELKMMEDSQPKSEEEAFENFYTPSHEALINWVLTDTATSGIADSDNQHQFISRFIRDY